MNELRNTTVPGPQGTDPYRTAGEHVVAKYPRLICTDGSRRLVATLQQFAIDGPECFVYVVEERMDAKDALGNSVSTWRLAARFAPTVIGAEFGYSYYDRPDHTHWIIQMLSPQELP